VVTRAEMLAAQFDFATGQGWRRGRRFDDGRKQDGFPNLDIGEITAVEA
jgi:hypothetical protein